MNKYVYRLFYDFEKEERWLNQMAARGWMMRSFVMGVYHFSKSAPGEYIYRIELLPRRVKAAESQVYLQFLEESGIEVVATWIRWVYYRRKASEGAFDIYSDIESRMAHYKRVLQMFMPLAVLWLMLCANNCFMILHSAYAAANVFSAAVYGLGGIAFSKAAGSSYMQYTRLQKEKKLHE